MAVEGESEMPRSRFAAFGHLYTLSNSAIKRRENSYVIINSKKAALVAYDALV